MLTTIKNIVLVLLVLNVIGYIFVVMRQKLLLKNNIIFINKKSVTKELLEEADLKQFTLSGTKVKSGDEIRIKTKGREKIEGILVGISQKEKRLFLITYEDEVVCFELNDINKLQIISKYGYFF